MKKPLALVIGINKPKPSRGAPPSFPFDKKPSGDSAAPDSGSDPTDAADPDQAEDDDQKAKISHAYDLIEQACSVLKELMGSKEGPDDEPSSAMGNPSDSGDQLAA